MTIWLLLACLLEMGLWFQLVPDGQYCNSIRVLQGSPVSLPGPKAGIQGVWKLLFHFSQQLLPRHVLYQCQCWIETFVPARPRWSLQDSEREALGPPWKKCPPQHWPNPAAPLAHPGAETLSWQQALFHGRALSAVTLLEELLGLDDWFFFILLVSICSETALLAGAMSGWSLAAGLWSLALLWLPFAGDTFLSGFAW